MKKAKIWGTVVATIVVLLVILRNRGAMEVDLIVGTMTMPRVVFLLVVLVIGFVLGLIVATRYRRKSA